MKYSRFVQIISLVLVLVIVGMSISLIIRKIDGIEVLGQALTLAVIIAALFQGYRWGVSSLLLCLALYVPLRLALKDDLTTSAAVQLVIAKVITYGALALLCSFLHTRLRYFFIQAEKENLVDRETEIGNRRFLLRELVSCINLHDRYERPFSLVTFTFLPEFLEKMKKNKKISVLRDISLSILKKDTRAVDELARYENQLMAILPYTRIEGASICGKRLENKIKKYLEGHLENGEVDQILTINIYSYPQDKQEFDSLLKKLGYLEDGDDIQKLEGGGGELKRPRRTGGPEDRKEEGEG